MTVSPEIVVVVVVMTAWVPLVVILSVPVGGRMIPPPLTEFVSVVAVADTPLVVVAAEVALIEAELLDEGFIVDPVVEAAVVVAVPSVTDAPVAVVAVFDPGTVAVGSIVVTESVPEIEEEPDTPGTIVVLLIMVVFRTVGTSVADDEVVVALSVGFVEVAERVPEVTSGVPETIVKDADILLDTVDVVPATTVEPPITVVELTGTVTAEEEASVVVAEEDISEAAVEVEETGKVPTVVKAVAVVVVVVALLLEG